jgi:methylenetetrahydrofolate reductase (NADPH)
MVHYKPDFISVTYGTGGSTRDKTLEIAIRKKNHFQLNHLFILPVLARVKMTLFLSSLCANTGISNILALRAIPNGENHFKPIPVLPMQTNWYHLSEV